MKCPVCKQTQRLTDRDLGEGLQSLECPRCGGQWIKSFQYWRWLEVHRPATETAGPRADGDLPTAESRPGKLCPECGHFLRNQRVGHGISFAVDRCGTCGGFWLDRDEWEVLKAHNLHDQVHLIFSQQWQSEVQADELAESYRRTIRQKVGDDDFQRVEQFKRWLAKHPKRSILLAFLNEPA